MSIQLFRFVRFLFRRVSSLSRRPTGFQRPIVGGSLVTTGALPSQKRGRRGRVSYIFPKGLYRPVIARVLFPTLTRVYMDPMFIRLLWSLLFSRLQEYDNGRHRFLRRVAPTRQLYPRRPMYVVVASRTTSRFRLIRSHGRVVTRFALQQVRRVKGFSTSTRYGRFFFSYSQGLTSHAGAMSLGV